MPVRAEGRSIARIRVRRTLLVLVSVVALDAGLSPPTAGAQAQPGIDELLARVGERIADFYKRAQHVLCIEKSTVQPINFRFSPDGFARTVESELHVEAERGDAGGEASVVRQVLKVNGRAPRGKDNKNRDGCTDPNPLSTEPLAFLLPAHRSEYQFKSAGFGNDRKRPAFLIDFSSVSRNSKLELVEDKEGHDDCFDWSGDLTERGRIWVDAKSYDVVRIERNVGGPVSVRVPPRIQRRNNLDSYVVIVRYDTTIRYRMVAFSNPEETLLLPESTDSLIVVQGGLQSTRRMQTYSDYKRFVGDSRVVE